MENDFERIHEVIDLLKKIIGLDDPNIVGQNNKNIEILMKKEST